MPSFVSLGVAFVAGLASILSPCILPLIPSYLTTMAGTSLTSEAVMSHQVRTRVMQNAWLFVLGFSVILVAAGLTASSLGRFVSNHRRLIAELGGILIIVFGLDIAGLIEVGLFKRDLHLGRVHPRRCPSLVMGLVFAAGWTPCVGPILASVLIMAANSHTVWSGAILLTSYATGLAVPFLLLATFLGHATRWTRKLGVYVPWIERIAGGLLVVLGALLVTGWFDLIPNLATVHY